MSWRIVVISKRAKLDYQLGYLVVRNEEVTKIHLSEISTILIESTAATVTTSLLAELTKKKIKVIFCDEKRNPSSELMPYYGTYNSSKKIRKQMQWDMEYAKEIWTYIVRQKILNQAEMLSKYGFETNIKLMKYAEEIEPFDMTNREAHAAKVYFNSLFGKEFSRDDVNSINAALNYGYGILLSNFNKEIVSDGYLTQLGIKHTNEYNPYNLSCDLMEPFRVLVDEIVFNNIDKTFDSDYKMQLVNVLNKRINYCGREYYVTNAIQIYLDKMFNAIEQKSFIASMIYQFE